MIRNEETSYFMSNHITSTSLGSRINCTNSSTSPVHKSFFQSSSPITTTTILPDGRVERRLETCSYQETEMVNFNCLSFCLHICLHVCLFITVISTGVQVLVPNVPCKPVPPPKKPKLELLLLFDTSL